MIMIFPITKRWFDMITDPDANKRKEEEYRAHKDYWGKRFAKFLGFTVQGKPSMAQLDDYLHKMGKSKAFWVCYRNGYSKNSPHIWAKVSLSIGTGREDWGAETGMEYYILSIHELSRYLAADEMNRINDNAIVSLAI